MNGNEKLACAKSTEKKQTLNDKQLLIRNKITLTYVSF